jgi:hypothetical protein
MHKLIGLAVGVIPAGSVLRFDFDQMVIACFASRAGEAEDEVSSRAWDDADWMAPLPPENCSWRPECKVQA